MGIYTGNIGITKGGKARVNTYRSKKFSLTSEQIQNIDWEDITDRIEKLGELYSEDRLEEMLPDLSYIANQFGHYEKICNEINDNYCSVINSTLENNGFSDQIFLSKSDLNKQFDPAEKRSRAENLANVMYLCNVIAKILRDGFTQKKVREAVPGINLTGDNAIIPFFFDVKKECLKELIRIREENESNKIEMGNLMIQYCEPDFMDEGGFFYVLLPEYFEPFVVQCIGIKITEDLKMRDQIPFYELDNNNWPVYYSARFPMKMNSKKEEAIEKFTSITRRRTSNENKNCAKIARFYMDMQLLFDPNLERYFSKLYKLKELKEERDRLRDELNGKTIRGGKKVIIVKKRVKGRTEKKEKMGKLNKKIERLEKELKGSR